MGCCANKGKACPTTTKEPFDCAAGVQMWETGWSPEKKAYCCSTVHIGCDAWDCQQGDERVWPENKKAFCCPQTGQGCPTTTTPFIDCNLDLVNWETSWDPAKRAYCCRTMKRGCDPWDCDAGVPAVWQQAKKDWCCK